ncbi:hypothetical protein T09_8233, partial [Trichinella sp. T9]
LSFYGVPSALGNISLSQSSRESSFRVALMLTCGLRHPMKIVPFEPVFAWTVKGSISVKGNMQIFICPQATPGAMPQAKFQKFRIF